MFQNLFDDLWVLDETDDSHLTLTFRAGKRVNLIDLPNEPCPILPICLSVVIRLKYARYHTILVFFFPSSAGDVTVMSVVSDHLFALIGHM